MQNLRDFMSSLEDSERTFIDAIIREQKDDRFEDTLDRKYEEGFIDGMRHAYLLLMNTSLDRPASDEIEAETLWNLRKQ